MRFILFILICTITFPAFAASMIAMPNTGKSTLSAEEEALLKKDLNGTVRGFIWKLPRTAILENEKGTFMGEEDGALFYLDNIRDMRCTIGYEFHEDKLWRVRIFVEKSYLDPQDRIRDLLTIQEDLNKRFGAPVSEDFRWLKTTDRDWPESWGWAVYRAELLITNKWQDAETDVTSYLGATKLFEPKLTVTYENREIKSYLNQQRAKMVVDAPR